MAALKDWLLVLNTAIKAKKLTQKEVASNAGISESYLSQILRGKKEPRLSIFVSIMLAMGIAPVITFE